MSVLTHVDDTKGADVTFIQVHGRAVPIKKGSRTGAGRKQADEPEEKPKREKSLKEMGHQAKPKGGGKEGEEEPKDREPPMNEDEKKCPKCGETGQWDAEEKKCKHCGSTEPPEKVEKKPEGEKKPEADHYTLQQMQMIRQAVQYRHGAGKEICVMCEYFLSDGFCQRVPGDIDPRYVCDLFEPRPTLNSRIPINDEGKYPDVPEEDFAGPHGSFPIRKQEDVQNAWDLAGHADKPDDVRSRIKAIANRKGFSPPHEGDDTRSDAYNLFPDEEEWSVVADAAGALKVRQLLTVCDAVNLNGRIYPREVMAQAITEANQRAAAGAMLMELRHPDTVKVSGRAQFVDNPDNKTARVDAIEMPDARGRVFFRFSCLPTPAGNPVADDYRKGKAYGVSQRMYYLPAGKKRINGQDAEVAKWLKVCSVDHVDNPAVPDTKFHYQLLTDSQKEDLRQFVAVSSPGSDRGTPAGDSAIWRSKVNENFTRALNRGYSLVAQRAKPDEINVIRKTLVDHITALEASGQSVIDYTKALVEFDATIGNSRVQGYGPGPGNVMVPGNNTGTPNGPGWGPDVTAGALMEKPGGGREDVDSPSEAIAKPSGDQRNLLMTQLGLDPDMFKVMQEAFQKQKEQAAVDAKKAKITTVCDGARQTPGLNSLSKDEQDYILARVQERALTLADDKCEAEPIGVLIQSEIDAYGKLAAAQRLAGGAYDPEKHKQGAQGQTVSDPGHPAYVTKTAMPWMENVKKVLAGCDASALQAFYSGIPGAEDPRSAEVQSRRKWNEEHFIAPMVDDWAKKIGRGEFKTATDWFEKHDRLHTKGEQALVDSIVGWSARSDANELAANLLNQPSIITAIIYQMFWDMKALQFVDGIGPGTVMKQGSRAGWEKVGGNVGSVLRIPIKYYNWGPAGTAATQPGPQWSPGLRVGEGIGIPQVTNGIYWVSYTPFMRKIAGQISYEAQAEIGHGPLNYDALGMLLYDMLHHNSMMVDIDLFNEMVDVSNEYNCTAVTAETVNLADNSVMPASGLVTVNLNMTKVAKAAVVPSTDHSVTYGTNVIAAIRLAMAAPVTSTSYFGTAGGTGAIPPIVVPRAVQTYDDALGTVTNSTNNPVAFTTPSSGCIEGFIDNTGQVQNRSDIAGTANYAIDYQNGVIVFTAAFNGASMAQTAGVISTPASIVLATYSYATNYDQFQTFNVTLGSGLTQEAYLAGLLHQLDTTAANMGSGPQYVKPDLMLCTLPQSVNITAATTFYQLNSPKGTELFPTEDFFANRNGILMARMNTPCRLTNNRFQLLRRGTTKFAVDTPFELQGPYPAYDSNNLIIDNKTFYGHTRQTYGTPQVSGTGVAATPTQGVSRAILTY